MSNVSVVIDNVKCIKHAEIELPLDKGLYGIIGNNACGKSTILLILSELIYRNKFRLLRKEECYANSKVSFSFENKNAVFTYDNDNKTWDVDNKDDILLLRGMHEGSLFYGTRFKESIKVDEYLNDGLFSSDEIVEADKYIKEKLSYVLHGDTSHYGSLKRVRNRAIAKRLELRNIPYFTTVNDNLISQYRMSSGECLLISLLHFIYNSVIRRSLPQTRPVPLLLDEIELALHPIAVSRLIDLLEETVEASDSFVVILTSHSPEVIRKISPRNTYKLENKDGNITVVNPCFPSYAIRDVYRHDGFDYLLLVEDELAKSIVLKIVNNNNLSESKLVHIVPVGGWTNVLDLHIELLSNNILGLKTTIISILDGDIKGLVGKKYSGLKKLFLPIESIEKFLYGVLAKNKNSNVKKTIGDKYFPLKSVDSLVKEFFEITNHTTKNIDKHFFKFLIHDLEGRKVRIDEFITHLTGDILEGVDFSNFKDSLSKLLNE